MLDAFNNACQTITLLRHASTVRRKSIKLACRYFSPKLQTLQINSTTMASGSVQGFDEVLNGQFSLYLKLSDQIGGDVKKQSDLAKQALHAQKDFLVAAAGRAKPSQDELTEMLKGTSEKIIAVEDFRNETRGSKHFNHLSSVSEGIGALGWVVAPSKPDVFIKEKVNAAEFYTNRVLKEFKEQDAKHVDWVKAFIGALKELEQYTKKYHSTALTWGK